MIALVILGVLVTVTQRILYRRRVTHMAKWRKHQLGKEGTGENFVLPHREEADGDDVRAVCKRVLLFQFGRWVLRLHPRFSLEELTRAIE